MRYYTNLLFILLIPAFLIGCNEQQTHEFQGEGDNWDVKYTSHIQDTNREDIEYIIRYTGKGDYPENIDYKIGSIEVRGATLNEKGFLEHTNSGCSGCAVTNENDELEVIIDWEGKSEEFILTQ